ncbi:centromere protein R isoform X2 [Neopelma chrysocephalum]|uniref:centromere protein R isoform X2 n=1 Tax=Neopelma chrysocephalum TaxID=114329 RepID=UPI000FCD06DF|nr:centromere protein R isoform X2 [Neopelma chrysocephalum]
MIYMETGDAEGSGMQRIWIQKIQVQKVLPTSTAGRVKRALKLDTVKKDNPSDATPQKVQKKNLNSYSPTTGTCEMSPCSSPVSHNEQNPRNPPAKGGREQSNSDPGLSRRGQPPTEQDGFLKLQSQVRSSLGRILKIRANLTSLQALEGSRELENILGVSDSSRALSAEVQKTQTLLSQAEELQLLKANHGKLPAPGYFQTVGSTEFLNSLLEQSKEPLGLLPAFPSTQALAQRPGM